MLINEDTIRARERSAAGQQLSEHISDIIMGHQITRRSPQASCTGSPNRSKTSDSIPGGPFVTVRSIPSSSGGARLWKTTDYAGTGMTRRLDGDAGAAAAGAGVDFMSGTVRGWRSSQVQASSSSAAAQGLGLPAQRTIEGPQQGMGVGLGDFMIHQLQMEQQVQQHILLLQQQQQQGWPRDPQPAAAAGGANSRRPSGETKQQQTCFARSRLLT